MTDGLNPHIYGIRELRDHIFVALGLRDFSVL